MSLKYEPASEPLHIYVKQLVLVPYLRWHLTYNLSPLLSQVLIPYRGTSLIRSTTRENL